MKPADSSNTDDPSASPWNRYWFADVAWGDSLGVVKIGLALTAFLYFASHWSDIGFWFGGDGVLSAGSVGGFLIDADLGSSVGWRLSPLYWIDSPMILRGYLLVGMGLAVASGWVTQTRAVSVVLWLWVVWLANRSLLVSGLEDLVLAWGLGYLAIAPASKAGRPAWCGSLARRLIQLHVSFLILATGLTMLSSLAWWDGTGVMAIVAPVELRTIRWATILSEPWLHEPLSHAVLIAALVSPILLWIAPTQKIGWGVATGWCVVLGLLSSHWIYFASVGVLVQSFRPFPVADEAAE